MTVPGGSADSTRGSAVGLPWASYRHSWSNWRPALSSLVLMPLVTMDAEMSTRKGVVEVGMPMATGLGVNTTLVPPCGATLADAGPGLAGASEGHTSELQPP